MSRIVLLDAGPLDLVTHPRPEQNREAALWLRGLLAADVLVRVPGVSDYEVRRELLRAGRTEGVARLDRLAEEVGYPSLVTEAMGMAARLWADARTRGRPTAPDESLDAATLSWPRRPRRWPGRTAWRALSLPRPTRATSPALWTRVSGER